jgi:hypothetical protein
MKENNSSKNANHFYNAWLNLSKRAEEAYHDYTVALDIVSLVERPRMTDDRSYQTISAQLEVYNTLNQRLRFYRSRYLALQKAATDTIIVWMDLTNSEKETK